jgi:hypothetical protein
MLRKALILGMSFAFVLLSACSHLPAGISASSSPLPQGQYQVLGHASGESQYVSILSLFPMGIPDYDASIRSAIAKHPGGKALINVRSHFTTLFLWIVSIHTLTVEGDVISY